MHLHHLTNDELQDLYLPNVRQREQIPNFVLIEQEMVKRGLLGVA